jgi:ABC-2 type transport system permease protein
MGSGRTRIAVLAAKELAELRAGPLVLAGPLLMLLTAAIIPLVVAIGVPRWTGEPLAEAEDLVAMAQAAVGTALDAESAVQALLIGQFLPLLVLVPVIGAMALVTTSIVDELHARSLEPLLATPITTLELLVAKAGSAFLVSLALLAAGGAVLAIGTGALAGPGVVTALATPRALAVVAGLGPAAAAAAVMLGVVVSSRARDARTAQQFSVLIVLPLVALFVSQIGDADGVGVRTLLAWAAAGWLLAAAFAVVGVRVFDRERILTRWTR